LAQTKIARGLATKLGRGETSADYLTVKKYFTQKGNEAGGKIWKSDFLKRIAARKRSKLVRYLRIHPCENLRRKNRLQFVTATTHVILFILSLCKNMLLIRPP
jgi:hypothetical protein